MKITFIFCKIKALFCGPFHSPWIILYFFFLGFYFYDFPSCFSVSFILKTNNRKVIGISNIYRTQWGATPKTERCPWCCIWLCSVAKELRSIKQPTWDPWPICNEQYLPVFADRFICNCLWVLFRMPTPDSSKMSLYLWLKVCFYRIITAVDCKFSLEINIWGRKGQEAEGTEKLVFRGMLGVEIAIRDAQAEMSEPSSFLSIAH